ncbi:signal peptidase I [Actinophytocola sp.]|uniref:signal peptidase I n=1 Tax=Actinophytocola sp. TaxID=1872138 RepID=UPI002ED43CAD
MKLPSARTVKRWSALAAVVGARAVVSCLIGLLLWAIVPALLGWTNAVVHSGSMAPALRQGDVVSFAKADQARVGDVILAKDPAAPERLLSHRVSGILADGSLITRGDANDHPDSTPVPSRNYLGTARLRIPWVGLPVMWWQEHRYVPIAFTVSVTALLVVVAVPKTRTVEQPAQVEQPTSMSRS